MFATSSRYLRLFCLAGAFCGLSSTARGQGQPADLDSLERRVSDLQWRAQQSDGLAAEVAQLRWQLAALQAQQFRPAEQPLTPAAMQVGDYQPVVLAQAELPVPSPLPSPSRPSNYLPATTESVAPPTMANNRDAGYGANGYGDGLQWGFWGWLQYAASPQEHYDTFWATQAQLDVTKSFSDRLAASADISFYDANNQAQVELDQLFLSILFPDCHDSILTLGKFYGPFGIEARTFWQRETGDTTLLYPAIPQELVGAMYTQPVPVADVTLRPFVVNGINDNVDINQQPSLGLIVDYRPVSCLSFGWTNWWGPEFTNDNGDKLYFTLAQSAWQITPTLSFEGEFLYGETASPDGRQDWSGYALIANQRLFDRWRIFAQWSELHDPNGFITGEQQHGEQAGVGFSYYLDRHVETRFQYSREMWFAKGSANEIDNEFYANVTFGY